MEAPLKQTWTRVLGAGNDAPIILQLLQPGQDRMQQDNTEQNEDSQGTVCWEIMVFSSFIYSGRSTNDQIIQSWKAEQEERRWHLLLFCQFMNENKTQEGGNC